MVCIQQLFIWSESSISANTWVTCYNHYMFYLTRRSNVISSHISPDTANREYDGLLLSSCYYAVCVSSLPLCSDCGDRSVHILRLVWSPWIINHWQCSIMHLLIIFPCWTVKSLWQQLYTHLYRPKTFSSLISSETLTLKLFTAVNKYCKSDWNTLTYNRPTTWIHLYIKKKGRGCIV